MVKRTNCVLCSGHLRFVQVFKNFPVYMGVTDKSEPELYQDMEFCSCIKCGCVQLSGLVDPQVLYKHPHNPAIGKTWELHNQALSEFVISTGAKNIIDIGGANMKIANAVCKSSSVESYTVCDVSVGSYLCESNPKVSTIQDYIENIESDKKYDTAVLSHTLEHFYNPVQVLSKIKDILTADGVVVVSVPNIEQQLKDGFLNALNFEHTYYISHDYMNFMVGMAGLQVVDRHDFSKHNSFYLLKRTASSPEFPVDISKARVVYETFVKNLLKDVANINFQTIGKKMYCFGAHIFTQMLIASGLNTDSIIGVLDNDKSKNGKFLYGTNLMVYNPSFIAQEEEPCVVLRVAQYKDEIVDSIKNHNQGVKII